MKEITIDTETGGLDPLRHALLQIGAYDPTTQGRFNVYIRKPDNLEVTPKASAVNGWPTSHDGKVIVDEGVAIRSLIEWIKLVSPDRIWYHNAPFDVGFLKNAMSRNGIDPGSFPRGFCTMSKAESLNSAGGLPVTSLSLDSLLKELCPTYVRPQVHDASEDAYATWLVKQAMHERFDRLAAMANGNAVQALTQGINTQPRQTHRRSKWGR